MTRDSWADGEAIYLHITLSFPVFPTGIPWKEFQVLLVPFNPKQSSFWSQNYCSTFIHPSFVNDEAWCSKLLIRLRFHCSCSAHPSTNWPWNNDQQNKELKFNLVLMKVWKEKQIKINFWKRRKIQTPYKRCNTNHVRKASLLYHLKKGVCSWEHRRLF